MNGFKFLVKNFVSLLVDEGCDYCLMNGFVMRVKDLVFSVEYVLFIFFLIVFFEWLFIKVKDV